MEKKSSAVDNPLDSDQPQKTKTAKLPGKTRKSLQKTQIPSKQTPKKPNQQKNPRHRKVEEIDESEESDHFEEIIPEDLLAEEDSQQGQSAKTPNKPQQETDSNHSKSKIRYAKSGAKSSFKISDLKHNVTIDKEDSDEEIPYMNNMYNHDETFYEEEDSVIRNRSRTFNSNHRMSQAENPEFEGRHSPLLECLVVFIVWRPFPWHHIWLKKYRFIYTIHWLNVEWSYNRMLLVIIKSVSIPFSNFNWIYQN